MGGYHCPVAIGTDCAARPFDVPSGGGRDGDGSGLTIVRGPVTDL
jgi:hypothetical protein